MDTQARILLVEDNAADAEFEIRQIRRSGIVCNWLRVDNEAALRNALVEFNPNLIIADFTLPGFSGFEAMAIASAEVPEVPFIFVSGTIGEERAVKALNRGATDYVLKDNLTRLAPAVRRALDEAVVRAARREAEQSVRRLSYFNPLTELPRRSLFCERLNQHLSERNGAGVPTVIVFDIERLGVINDSLGRFMGDVLLHAVGQRLRGHFADIADTAHLDGGSFAVVMMAVDVTETALQAVYDEIANLFSQPLLVAGRDIPVCVHCGVAVPSTPDTDAESLLQSAEAALHQTRDAGLPWMQYRPEMNSRTASRLALEHRLRQALERDQFKLFYQPQIERGSGRVIGAEALLRWVDPEQGLVAPASFLHVLESTGLIISVGEWVLSKAAEDCERWQRLGLAPVRVAVNVSPTQLQRRNFSAKLLALSGLRVWEFGGLEVEITEEAMLEDPASLMQALRSLRAAGVRIAIDDFGTGYSSLGRLSQLPLDTLKIDRSFTSRLTGDAAGKAMVSTIISLAGTLDLETVAEGVETREQLALLDELGCAQSQGYLHSPPLPVDQFESLLAAARSVA